MPPSIYQIKGNGLETKRSIESLMPKRKRLFDGPNMNKYREMYTCEFPECPYNDASLGFDDRVSRNNHQMICPYRNSSCQRFGIAAFSVSNDAQTASPQSVRPKSGPPVVVRGSPSSSVYKVGLPDYDQRILSDLMLFYKDNNPVGASVVGTKNDMQTVLHGTGNDNCKPANFMKGTACEGAQVPGNPCVALDSSLSQFDQWKVFDSSFEIGFIKTVASSPFDLGSVVAIQPPKQDTSMWYI